MSEERLVELARRTLDILNQLIQEVNLTNVQPEHEVEIVGELGPVILRELIRMEKKGT